MSSYLAIVHVIDLKPFFSWETNKGLVFADKRPYNRFGSNFKNDEREAKSEQWHSCAAFPRLWISRCCSWSWRLHTSRGNGEVIDVSKMVSFIFLSLYNSLKFYRWGSGKIDDNYCNFLCGRFLFKFFLTANTSQKSN